MFLIQKDEKVLVTGAGGFLGSHVVKKLLDDGFEDVRCLVHSDSSKSRMEELKQKNPSCSGHLEVLQGDLCSRECCSEAVQGVKVIYHIAAGVAGKSYAGSYMKSVITTRNLIEAALTAGSFRRFVSIGSFASYDNRNLRRGACLDENCPMLDVTSPGLNPYTFVKTEQDLLVMQYGKEKGLPWVILRPGVIYGPGVKELITARVGISTFGFFMHLGGGNRIPLTYVENCADAVIRAGLIPGVEGNVFNIVDDDLPRSRNFLRAYKRNVRRFFSVPIPYWLFSLFTMWWERYSLRSKGQIPLVFSKTRTESLWKSYVYSNQKAKDLLGWTPAVPYQDALRRYFDFLTKRLEAEKPC